jgi:glycosyltransferase involved in cell wall biosynthesis
VLDLATMLVVHSRYVEDHVRSRGYDGPLRRVPHPAWPVPSLEPAALGGSVVVGAFGNVNASKRAPQLVAAFRSLRERHPAARLVLAGALAERYPEGERLERELAADPGVHREHYVDESRLWALMAACDVVVSLRAPTMGETSGTALRALSLGKPLVVSDLGWFAELPDAAALKVPVGEGEVETLAAALCALAEDEAARDAMGRAARALAEREHALPRVAEAYVAAVEESAGGEAVRDAVLGEVAHAAADVGLAETADVARRLREVGIGD